MKHLFARHIPISCVLVLGLFGIGSIADAAGVPVAVEQGTSHACALISDGTVQCWGANDNGSLGDGTTTMRTTPVTASAIASATGITVGDWYTCALISGGTVKCWGNNLYGQLGDGTNANRASPVTVTGITSAVAVKARGNHTCAILSDGTVKCWGENGRGHLGDGTTTNRYTPVTASGVTSATALALGNSNSCAIVSGGAVKCWGENNDGQVGDNTAGNFRSTPTLASGVTNAVSISVGASQTCAVLSDQTIKCWGQTPHAGQLNVPTLVSGVTTAAKVSLGLSHDCVVLADQTVKCWGSNNKGQLGNGTFVDTTAPGSAIPALTGVVAITTGDYGTCALLSSQSVKCWGQNGAGEAGNGTISGFSFVPALVPGAASVSKVSAGSISTCAIVSGGGVKCWGYNGEGQLGDGTTENSIDPVTVSGISNAIAVSTGFGMHACVLISDGTIKCWGINDDGQLGDGTNDSTLVATTVSDISTAISVAVGARHTCAALSGGTVKCWGNNEENQLGDGGGGASNMPVTVSNIGNAVSVASNNDHTCALLADQTMKCWGSNDQGQLGDGTWDMPNIPVDVANISTATSVSVGAKHSCAVLSSGAVKCWGNNDQGQLGDGTWGGTNIPIAVSGISTAVSVSAGYLHACAALSGGTVKCWGNNDQGELGDGTTDTSLAPVSVSGISIATWVSAGGDHSCALLSDGTVKCWGSNDQGQTGSNGWIVSPTVVTGYGGLAAWSVSLFVPVSIAFPSTSSSGVTQVANVSGGQIRITDNKWASSGYYLTVSTSNFTSGGTTISNANVLATVSGATVSLVSGAANPSVTIPTGSGAIGSGYVSIASAKTLMQRTGGGGITGVYGVSMALRVSIPAYTPVGNYSGTVTFTLIEN